jgi:integration host factor subunit beta
MPDRQKNTYTKRDVAKYVADATGENINTVALWVDHVVDALRGIMMSAHPELRIEIRDFGVFEVKRTRSKPKARNPKSGEIIYVPPRRKTHFKPSKLLRKFLAQPLEDPEQTKQQDSGRARQS